MGLQYADIGDAVALTLDKMVKENAFLNLQTDITRYVAAKELWDSKKKVFDGGNDWRFDAQIDENYSAKAVKMYQRVTSAFADTMITGKVSPRHINANYVYDLREPDFQRGGTQIISFLKTKYSAMMMSWYNYLEKILWTKPVDSTDDVTPYGIPYWITKGTSKGFTGLDPSGFTAGRAGISSVTYPRFANYSSPYVDVSPEDLIYKMVEASYEIDFVSPLSNSSEPTVGGTKTGIYTNLDVTMQLITILRNQNMDLGNDLAAKDGKSLFHGVPITNVPYLKNDTQNPVYMIDWTWLAIGVMAGWESNLSKPNPVTDMPLVRRVDMDATLNTICTNPRRQAEFHVA